MIDSLIESFLRFWSFFALIHIGCGRERNLVTRNYSRILVSFFLIVYAINTVMIVYLDKPKVNVISASANLMQFLLNLLMVSVVLIVLMRNVKLAKRIISELLQFSSKLNDLDIAINYKKIQRIWYTIIGFSLAIILIYVAVEGCVVFVTKMMTIRYWSLTILPSIFMIMFLIKAICVLWLLFTFYKKINKAMRLEMTKKKDSPVEKQWIVQLSHSQMESPRGYSAAQTKDMVPGLLDIIKNLKEICHLVDIYFGPIFLVTFATIFVVTTTQFYYVYELISHSRKYYMTYWHLVMSFNIVAINLFLAICVTALCQSITNQVSEEVVDMPWKFTNDGHAFYSRRNPMKLWRTYKLSIAVLSPRR